MATQSSKTNMRKTNQRMVPRSAKTRLSDLTPKKDARGGKMGTGGMPEPQRLL